jgi:hypothetical protein
MSPVYWDAHLSGIISLFMYDCSHLISRLDGTKLLTWRYYVNKDQFVVIKQTAP